MKKILAVMAMLIGMTSIGYCYTETNETAISTETVTIVSVSSSAWTAIFTNSTDVILSTSVTGNVNLKYRIHYYNVRNNANADTDVALSIDNTTTSDLTWYISDGEIFNYTIFSTRYARLLPGQSGTVNLYIEKNYIKYP